MKLKLNNEVVFLHFKYTKQFNLYTIKEHKHIAGNYVEIKTIVGAEEMQTECTVRNSKLEIIATGKSLCHYSDRFVKAIGREKAINNLVFTELEGWKDVNVSLIKKVKKQYNNRK